MNLVSLKSNETNYQFVMVGAIVLMTFLSMDGWAQGTVLFGNRVSAPFIDAPVTDSRTGQRLSGPDWRAQLYWAPGPYSETVSLRPVLPSVPFQTGPILSGYFAPVIVTIPDANSRESVLVQARVWNSAAGGSYEEASASPIGVIGESNRMLVITGDSNLIAPGELTSLRAFAVFPVPEPTIGAFAGLIAAVCASWRMRSSRL